MKPPIATANLKRATVLLLASLLAAGCAGTRQRLAEVGKPPAMAPMQDPAALYANQPVLWPVATAAAAGPQAPASLWQTGARTFFGDPRASKVGDILTISINIDDQASFSNATSRSRTSEEGRTVNSFLGLNNALLGRLLPGGADTTNLVDAASNSQFSGDGAVDRSESLELTIAAVVTQLLPNGNLVVAGRQEVRVNHELRELTVTGVVRPMDITAANTIPHDKIAEARISYGGRGTVSNVQRPPAGQQVMEILLPF